MRDLARAVTQFDTWPNPYLPPLPTAPWVVVKEEPPKRPEPPKPS